MTTDLFGDLRDLAALFAPYLADYGWDALALLGLALLELGLYLVSPTAALVVLGLILLAVGVWGARLWAAG